MSLSAPVRDEMVIPDWNFIIFQDAGREVLRITAKGELICADATEAALALKREWDRLRPASQVEAGEVGRLRKALVQISAGAANGEVEFRRRLGGRSKATWHAVNALQDYLAASGGTARAALARKEQP